MRVYHVKAVQAHYVPKSAHAPRGPFPPEMQGYNPGYAPMDDDGTFDLPSADRYEEQASQAAQPDIVYDYAPEDAEDGEGFAPGATAQNNFSPAVIYRCRYCQARVSAEEREFHDCDIEEEYGE